MHNGLVSALFSALPSSTVVPSISGSPTCFPGISVTPSPPANGTNQNNYTNSIALAVAVSFILFAFICMNGGIICCLLKPWQGAANKRFAGATQSPKDHHAIVSVYSIELPQKTKQLKEPLLG